MKDLLASHGKWLLSGLLLLSIAILMLFGLGCKRGTSTYRWRMALWTAALALLGTVSLSTGCTPPTCYKPMPPHTFEQPPQPPPKEPVAQPPTKPEPEPVPEVMCCRELPQPDL